MRDINFVSVKLTLFLMLGIVLGFHVYIPLWLCLLLVATGLFWLIISVRKGFGKKLSFALALGVLMIGMGAFLVQSRLGSFQPEHYFIKEYSEYSLWKVTISNKLKTTAYAERFVLEIHQLNQAKAAGKILWNAPLDSFSKALKIDDTLVLAANAEVIPPPRNPGQFSYQKYLSQSGILHQFNRDSKVLHHEKAKKRSLFGLAQQLRDHLSAGLKEAGFSQEVFGVVQALLLGQRSDIPKALYKDYQNAGAVHILAISGLHVGVLVLIFQAILFPLTRLPKGKVVRLLALIFLLWGFAFITGLSASVVRAVTMFSFLSYAWCLDRPTSGFNLAALSMLALLLVKPLFLFQVGFQMSYAAVFAILWLYPKLQVFWSPEPWLLKKTWSLLAVSVSAQLGVLPISLFYFHQFPTLFFVSNLLIVPFLGILLGGGLIVLGLASMRWLPSEVVWIYEHMILAMNRIIQWVAHFEGFVLREIPFELTEVFLSYIGIICLVTFLEKPTFLRLKHLAISIALFQGYSLFSNYSSSKNQNLIIPHSFKSSALWFQQGKHLEVFSKDSLVAKNALSDFKIEQSISEVNYLMIQNSFRYKGQIIYKVDRLAIPPPRAIHVLWLTESPKLHLGRWLEAYQPKSVIADGSNYPSYISRWKKTCEAKGIPFHDTSKDGAYLLNSTTSERSP
ncbi:MAG: ComEC/Rec2 family competence protein [Bacteroidota bacterium]